MALSVADLAALSRLFDEAQALEPGDRERWLAQLTPQQARHGRRLRQLLVAQEHLTRDGRLATLPVLGHGAIDAGDTASAGERVGAYRLLREIGRGGMGSVWLAERADGHFRRDVALKLPRLSWGAGLAERMAREREIGALLEHPSIARLYDAGVDERGRPYIAMEYIDGLAIDLWCEQQRLDLRQRLALFVQVVRAVAYAHGRLVIHRDLKPANVLVNASGRAFLLDFGIAKLIDEAAAPGADATQEHGRMLTPRYAAPEQLEGGPVGVQADVYALGVLLFELLTGQLPYEVKRPGAGAIEQAILDGNPASASARARDPRQARALRGEIDALLAKALRRDPAERYATADALASDIERHLAGRTISARPDTALYRLGKAARRHWMGMSAAAAVLAALLGGGGLALLQAQRAGHAVEREQVVKEFVADVFRASSRAPGSASPPAPLSRQSLLEGSAQLIEQRFAGQPDLQAELYGMVGKVFHDMGAYTLAVGYLSRQHAAQLAAREGGVARARTLLDLAQAQLDAERAADAEPPVRQALELVRGRPGQELDALVLLMRVQLALAQVDAATATMGRVDAQLAAGGAGPSLARAWALATHGRLLILQNRLDDALPVYQQAIGQARSAQGTLSTAAISIQLGIASQLATTARVELARRQFDEAISALQALGGAHEVRAAYESARFAWISYTGFFNSTAAQAIAAVERSRAALAGMQQPIPEWFIPQVEFWLGDIKANSGDIAGGLPLLERHAALLAATLDTPRERYFQTNALGLALMFAGRHDEADRALRERMALRRQLGSGGHPRAAFDYIHISHNLMMEGRHAEALAVLDGAPRFEEMRGEGAAADRYNQALATARAEVLLAQGDTAGALALAGPAYRAAGTSSLDVAFRRPLYGEALCAAGRTAEGLALLKAQLAADDQGDDDPRAPWQARLRAVTGLCALAAGDGALALRVAAQARAALSAQPTVSHYFERPLLRLERALGTRSRQA